MSALRWSPSSTSRSRGDSCRTGSDRRPLLPERRLAIRRADGNRRRRQGLEVGQPARRLPADVLPALPPDGRHAGRAAALRTSGDLEVLSRDLLGLSQSIDRRMALSNVVPFREIVNRDAGRRAARRAGLDGVRPAGAVDRGDRALRRARLQRRAAAAGDRAADGHRRPPGHDRADVSERVADAARVRRGARSLPAALAVTRLVSSMLFGMSPHDPLSIGAALTCSPPSRWPPPTCRHGVPRASTRLSRCGRSEVESVPGRRRTIEQTAYGFSW